MTRPTEVQGKLADFDEIYGSRDPRAYFRGLAPLGYEVPHHGQRIFRRILEALPADDPVVVDLCCSYGVNAALLKHRLSLQDLYAHYCSPLVQDLSIEELTDLDRQFYAGRRLPDAPTVVGIDIAGAAIDYALGVGLLDRGYALDLEQADPSAQRAAVLGRADLIVVTGGIGYVTAASFDRLLACAPATRPPWVVALCLRTVSFQPIAELFARRGLITEKLDGTTFPQRRFTGEAEEAYALQQLAELGIDPSGREDQGRYHVDVFLARPADAAAGRSVHDLLGDLDLPGDDTEASRTSR